MKAFFVGRHRRNGELVLIILGGLVTTGAFHEGSVEIVEGVSPGDIVVTRGQTGLVDGSLVRISSGPSGARDAGLASAGALASGAL